MTDMLPGSTRILVVDDDPSLVLLVSKMLARVGVTPTTAADGTQALEQLYNEAAFDLLILDLMLPDVDGFEILSQLRADIKFNDMPVLILSARADPDTIQRGLDMGADGYLTKPYLPNTLTSRVRAILAQGRRQVGKQRFS
jgi:DNA-binding response OmpR family regulator